MNVNRADEIAYGDPQVLRLATLFWFTTHDYPPSRVTAYRTLILGPIVSLGQMDLGSMSGAVHV